MLGAPAPAAGREAELGEFAKYKPGDKLKISYEEYDKSTARFVERTAMVRLKSANGRIVAFTPEDGGNIRINYLELKGGVVTRIGGSDIKPGSVVIASAALPEVAPAALPVEARSSFITERAPDGRSFAIRYGPSHLPQSEWQTLVINPTNRQVGRRDAVAAVTLVDSPERPHMMDIPGARERVPVIRFTVQDALGGTREGYFRLNARGLVTGGVFKGHDIKAEPGAKLTGPQYASSGGMNPHRAVAIAPDPKDELPTARRPTELPPVAYIRFGRGDNDLLPISAPLGAEVQRIEKPVFDPKATTPNQRYATPDEMPQLLTKEEKERYDKMAPDKQKEWATSLAGRTLVTELTVVSTMIEERKDPVLIRYDDQGQPLTLSYLGSTHTAQEARELTAKAKQIQIPGGWVPLDRKDDPKVVAASKDRLVREMWQQAAERTGETLLGLSTQTDDGVFKPEGIPYTTLTLAPSFRMGGRDLPGVLRGVGPATTDYKPLDATGVSWHQSTLPLDRWPEGLKTATTGFPLVRMTVQPYPDDITKVDTTKYLAALGENGRLFPPVRVSQEVNGREQVGYVFGAMTEPLASGTFQGTERTIRFMHRDTLPSYVATAYDTLTAVQGRSTAKITLSDPQKQELLKHLEAAWTQDPDKSKLESFRNAVGITAQARADGTVFLVPIVKEKRNNVEVMVEKWEHAATFSPNTIEYQLRNLNSFGHSLGPVARALSDGKTVTLNDASKNQEPFKSIAANPGDIKAFRLADGSVFIAGPAKDGRIPHVMLPAGTVQQWTADPTKCPFKEGLAGIPELSVTMMTAREALEQGKIALFGTRKKEGENVWLESPRR